MQLELYFYNSCFLLKVVQYSPKLGHRIINANNNKNSCSNYIAIFHQNKKSTILKYIVVVVDNEYIIS